MQKFKTLTGATAALLVAFLFAVSVPAFAHEGDSTTTNSGTDDTTTSTSTEQENETSATTSSSKREELKAAREAKVAAAKKTADEKKAERQEKVCENRKKGLTVRSSRIVANSKRIDEKITDIYKKVDNYKTTNNVTVANYDELTAAITTAQDDANTAISDLEKVVPTTDCTSTTNTNSTDVATFKTAAKKTRDSLKAYRSAVKKLLVAVAQAKGDDKTTTTDTNTSTGGAQ
jgi:hypothetical protein